MFQKKIYYDNNNFLSKYLPDPTDTNDSKLMELPKLINLSTSGEILSRRKRKIVLKYHKPNEKRYIQKNRHIVC